MRLPLIKRETRKNIIDHFEIENIHFSGRMTDIDFLERLYNLKKLPSSDPRFENAAGDIWQHSVNNSDYEGNWVFGDDRFGLLNGSEETFLRFICEMAHPLVRPDTSEAKRILVIANDWLREEGWELYPLREIAGGKILAFREASKAQKLQENEVAHIWLPNMLRFFISHRDVHKVNAKKLGEDLMTYGISSFVAHDSIQAMSTWKHEIMKALQTMDAFLCYITNDFYNSEWTNQEIGFALAKGVPIYLYSIDGTDPKGFKLDTQAIKTGLPDLISCIKGDFSRHSVFKNKFLANFIAARDGSFSWAKDKFFELVGLEFTDSEITSIVDAFSAKAKTSINQLGAVLYDPIKDEHKRHPRLRNYSYYREYLNNDILKLHSTSRFEVRVLINQWNSEDVIIFDKEKS